VNLHIVPDFRVSSSTSDADLQELYGLAKATFGDFPGWSDTRVLEVMRRDLIFVALEQAQRAGYIALRNDLSPVDYLGADLMLRGSYRILTLLEARAEFGYTFPLSVSQARSPLGRPLRELALRAGAALPFGSRYAFELSYQADFLAFTYVTRAAHGVALGFDTSF